MLEELEFTTVSSILWNTSPEVGILFMILLIIYLISLLLKNSLLYLTKLRSTREIRAVYTRDNKPRLTLASAYIRGERNHLYECGLHKMRTAGINGSRLSPRPDQSNDDVVCFDASERAKKRNDWLWSGKSPYLTLSFLFN